jgi:hypothetical protein
MDALLALIPIKILRFRGISAPENLDPRQCMSSHLLYQSNLER